MADGTVDALDDDVALSRRSRKIVGDEPSVFRERHVLRLVGTEITDDAQRARRNRNEAHLKVAPRLMHEAQHRRRVP
jgi:hypothetical protein